MSYLLPPEDESRLHRYGPEPAARAAERDTDPFGGPQDHGTIDDLDVAIAASSPPASVSSRGDTAMIMLLGPTIWRTVRISGSDPRRWLIVAAVAAGTRRKNQAQIGADRPPAGTAS
jgi:hypothetical protein